MKILLILAITCSYAFGSQNINFTGVNELKNQISNSSLMEIEPNKENEKEFLDLMKDEIKPKEIIDINEYNVKELIELAVKKEDDALLCDIISCANEKSIIIDKKNIKDSIEFIFKKCFKKDINILFYIFDYVFNVDVDYIGKENVKKSIKAVLEEKYINNNLLIAIYCYAIKYKISCIDKIDVTKSIKAIFEKNDVNSELSNIVYDYADQNDIEIGYINDNYKLNDPYNNIATLENDLKLAIEKKDEKKLRCLFYNARKSDILVLNKYINESITIAYRNNIDVVGDIFAYALTNNVTNITLTNNLISCAINKDTLGIIFRYINKCCPDFKVEKINIILEDALTFKHTGLLKEIFVYINRKNIDCIKKDYAKKIIDIIMSNKFFDIHATSLLREVFYYINQNNIKNIEKEHIKELIDSIDSFLLRGGYVEFDLLSEIFRYANKNNINNLNEVFVKKLIGSIALEKSINVNILPICEEIVYYAKQNNIECSDIQYIEKLIKDIKEEMKKKDTKIEIEIDSDKKNTNKKNTNSSKKDNKNIVDGNDLDDSSKHSLFSVKSKKIKKKLKKSIKTKESSFTDMKQEKESSIDIKLIEDLANEEDYNTIYYLFKNNKNTPPISVDIIHMIIGIAESLDDKDMLSCLTQYMERNYNERNNPILCFKKDNINENNNIFDNIIFGNNNISDLPNLYENQNKFPNGKNPFECKNEIDISDKCEIFEDLDSSLTICPSFQKEKTENNFNSNYTGNKSTYNKAHIDMEQEKQKEENSIDKNLIEDLINQYNYELLCDIFKTHKNIPLIKTDSFNMFYAIILSCDDKNMISILTQYAKKNNINISQ